jgi:signal transduction histidine kinase/heme-degrading monooxygenase HmoA
MSKFRVVNDKAAAVRQAFLNRPRLVEDALGFLDFEVLTDNDDASCFYLLTRWTNLPAFRAWHSSEAHRQSHQGMPSGLKLDPSFTKVLTLNPIAGGPTDEGALRSEGKSPSLAETLESSRNIPYLQITSQGEISTCNPATLLQLRLTEVQVMGRKIWDFLTSPDAEWLQACIATLRQGQSEKHMLNFVDSNASPFSLECTVSALPRGFALLGEPLIESERVLSNELLQLNNQVTVLARESARQKKELARTNVELEKALKDLETSRDQLRALTARLQSIREEERKRVAHDVHEQLGQALIALKVDVNSLLSELPGGPWSRRMSSIEQLVNQTIQTVREISSQLSPSMLGHLGLAATVEWAVEDFGTRTGIRCRLDLPEEELALDSDRATAIYRILQELLTNVAQHARVSEVRVRLAKEGGELTLEVHDNGVGIPEDKLSAGASLGILGMREQAMRLGGELTLSSPAGKGTTVRVWIPA